MGPRYPLPENSSDLDRVYALPKRPSTSSPRHFSILHGTGGGGTTSPRVWLLIELELRFKNQRVACHETKPLTPEFKVLGQPVTSEVRSMTQKWQKCEFGDDFVSEQARAAISRPERSLRSYECNAIPFGPIRPVFGGQNSKKIFFL